MQAPVLMGFGEASVKRGRMRSSVAGPADAVAAGLALLILFPLAPVVAATVALLSAWVAAWGRRPSFGSPALLPLAAYCLLAAATLVLLRDLGAALRWGQTVMLMGALFLPATIAGPQDRLRICRFLVYLAAALSVYAVVEVTFDLPAAWGPPPLNGQGEIISMDNEILVGSGLGRAEATLVEPLLLSFLVLIALALALQPEVLPRRRLPVIGVLVGGLLASGSRSAAAVAFLVFLVASVRSMRLRLLLAALATVGGLGVVAGLGLLRPDLGERVLANPSVAHRLEGVNAAIALVGDQAWWRTLIGNGYGQVLRLFREGRLQSDGFYAVDNQFAYTFAELGMVGLVVLGWLLWRAFACTDGLVALAMAAGVLMFLSFDVLANASSLGLLVILLGLTRRRMSGDRSGDPMLSTASLPAQNGSQPGDTGTSPENRAP